MTRLVLFSDGTGNSSAKAQKTNVWRMFQALDQTTFDQLAKYDDGVGTSSNKYLAALGGAFGFGLKRNVIDLYKFVCRTYQPGDEIFGFGFSRGAFTIRVLVGLIATQGLVVGRSESELHANALAAYRQYRVKRFKSKSPLVWAARKLRDLLFWPSTHAAARRAPGPFEGPDRVPIRFLGLWETVGAYGMPIDELKWGFNLLVWPMVAVDTFLFPCVERACHALALDEQRETFTPILFDEAEEARRVAQGTEKAGRLTQVWFAGVHSNVGGGYPEDQASLVSLDWMMSQAADAGLRLKDDATAELAATKSPYARLYDSRAGLMAYYRYAPRRVAQLVDPHRHGIRPIVHGSVVMRMARGSDSYAPISLPETFNVLAPDGSLMQMTGFAADAAAHVARSRSTTAADQVADRTAALRAAIEGIGPPDSETVRQVQDTVWWRRVTYFSCLFFTLCLVFFPFAVDAYAQALHFLVSCIPWIGADLAWEASTQTTLWDTFGQGGVRTIVNTVSPILPKYFGLWLRATEREPSSMAVAVALVAIPFSLGTLLANRVHDRAWFAWHPKRRVDYLDWIVQSAKSGWIRAAAFAVGFGLLLAAARFWAWDGRTADLLIVALALSAAVLAWRIWIALRLRKFRQAVASGHKRLPSTPALRFARTLRSSRLLGVVYWWLTERIIPIFVVLLFALGVLACVHQLVYQGANAAGVFCTPSPMTADAGSPGDDGQARRNDGFETRAECWASGLAVKRGLTYEVELRSNGDWFDQTLRTDVAGFSGGGTKHLLAWPLKRWWRANWFQPILRVGAIGNDEYAMSAPLQPPVVYEAYDGPPVASLAPIDPAQAKRILAAHPWPDAPRVARLRFTAAEDGELFLYVNDALAMTPWTDPRTFYDNNTGTGTLTVRQISIDMP